MQTLSTGTKVSWRGSFGTDSPKNVTIKTIQHGKHGFIERRIKSTDKDLCTFTFEENDRWAWGYQIEILN